MFSRRVMIGLYVMAAVCLIDQLTKWLVIEALSDVHRTIQATPFLNIVLVWNKGVTFGMLNHGAGSYWPYILTAIAVVIVIMLGRWLRQTSSTVVAMGLGCIMGGAVGNVIDRIRYGQVVDFLDFYYGNYHWYAFNVADAAIVTGVTLLLIDGMIRGQ